MTAAVFVDSNVFLYAMDEGDKSKQEAARTWRSALWTSRLGRLSFQVLGEFYVNAMRLRPSARDEARRDRRSAGVESGGGRSGSIAAWMGASRSLSALLLGTH